MATRASVEIVHLYCRLSKLANAEDGLSAAIPRQEKLSRRVSARMWGDEPEVMVYVDDDVSAHNDKVRPDWVRMLTNIKTFGDEGRRQAVASYDLDRLYRKPRDLEDLFDICDAAGLTEMATAQGEIDLATSNGRLMARMMGAVNAKSSEDTSRRFRDLCEDRASRGEPVGGQRAFGWADKMTHDPAEAPIVREMVGRFLAGESQTNLARDLNARAIPTPWTRNHQEKVDTAAIDPKTGEPHQPRPAKRWASSSVRAVLTNPRHAGIRELKRRPGRKKVGPREVLVSVPAAWPAIITRADHEKVLAMLNDPNRRQVNPPRRGLLTGLVKCGECRLPMNKGQNGAGAGRMRCQRQTTTDNCGKVAISSDKLEALVVDLVLRRFERSPDLPRTIAGTAEQDDTTAAELVEVEDRLAQLVDMFTMGEIDRVGYARGRKTLEARQTALRASLSRQRRTTALDAFVGQPGSLRATWDDLSVDRQRAILSALVECIIIAPATTSGRWEPERITVTWRI